MNKNPEVSIIVNCFNGELYLRNALDSIFAQTIDDWEIIFWDNASTDASAKIAISYGSKLKYYKSKKKVPLGHARKMAVHQAKGKWIAFLDTDDIWYPHKLKAQLDSIRDSNYVLCYGGIREITPEGDSIRNVLPRYKSGNQFAHQLMQFEINMVTPIVLRSALIENKINFDCSIMASEEYNLFIRLAAKGEFCSLPQILGEWRISKNSLTFEQIKNWSKERLYTLKQVTNENQGIEIRYSDAFREARSRATYYLARYLMHVGKLKGARSALASIKNERWLYFTLWCVAFVPWLWDKIHNDNFKRKVSLFIGIVRKNKIYF